MPTIKPTLPGTYIFNAFFKEGKIVSKLKPLTNSIVALELVEADNAAFTKNIQDKKPVVFRTDINGKLKSLITPAKENGSSESTGKLDLDPNGYVHSVQTKKDAPPKALIAIPPVDAVSFLAAASAGQGAQWAKDLLEALSSFHPEGIEAIELQRNIPIANIEMPKKTPTTEEEKEYQRWYNAITKENRPLQGYIIAKVRAAILIINKTVPVDISQEIELYRFQGKPNVGNWDEESSADYYIASVQGTEVTLPEGLYKIRIPFNPEKNIDDWHKTAKDNGYYELAVWLKFDIQNPAGAFCIVSCDPVSVEEAIIKQFPRFYSHLISAAQDLKKGHDIADPSKKITTDDAASKSKQTSSTTPAKGFVDYCKSWSVAKESSQLAVKFSARDLSTHIDDNGEVYEGKKALAFDMAKAIHSSLSDKEDPRVKTAVDFGLALKSGNDAWADFEKKRAKYIEALDDGALVPWKKALKDEFVHLPMNSADDIAAHRQSLIGKLGVPKVATDLFGRAMTYIDLYQNTEAIVKGGSTLAFTTIPDFKKSKSNYKDIAKSYFDILGEKEIYSSVTLSGGFAFNSAELSKENILKIKSVIGDIKKGLEQDAETKIIVAGHTCDLGSMEYNQTLSEQRADAVKNELVNNHGIEQGRIDTKGHGEQHPIADNTNENNRSKNRRLEILALAPATQKVCPAREGMDTLERYRSLSVQKSLEVDEGAIKVAQQATDMALGVMAIIPATAPFAAAIFLAGAAKDIAVSAGKLLDEWGNEGAINKFFQDRKRLATMSKESRANQGMLKELFADKKVGDKLSASNDTIWAAQYRLRAEALAGLVGIMMRAASAADGPKDYLDRLEKYCIKAYINNFIIGDNWAYPLNGLSDLKMEEYWLYAISSFDKDKPDYQALKLETFGLDADNHLVDAASTKDNKTAQSIAMLAATRYSSAHGGYYMTRPPQAYTTDTLSANFQSYFPVHAFGSDDIKSFGETFNPIFSNYGRAQLYKTAIYYLDQNTNKWVLYKDKITTKIYGGGRRRVSHYPEISPFTPVRILVVFNDEMVGIAPLSFRLSRTDGIDIPGPTYKALAAPLGKEELLDYQNESQYAGRVGCVFYPFFSLGKKTFRGTKPLATSKAFWIYDNAKDYNNAGNLRHMYYSYSCSIGENNTFYDIPLSSELDSNNEIKLDSDFFNAVADDFKVSINTEARPGELALLEKHFLISKTPDYEYPPLFSGEKRVRVLTRIGGENSDYFMPVTKGGDYIMPGVGGGTFTSPTTHIFDDVTKNDTVCKRHEIEVEGFEAKIKNFDWRTPVEFVFVFTCTELLKEGYSDETNHSDYRQIPMSVNLCEESRWMEDQDFSRDTTGPQLSSTLQYLGKASRSSAIKPEATGFGKYTFTDDNFDFVEDAKRIPNRPFKRNANLKPIIDILKQEDDKARALIGWQERPGEHNNTDKERYVYAAHISCKYLSPKALEVNSIRPFGKDIFERAGKFDEYIQYYFKNFKTVEGSTFGTVDHNGGAAFFYCFETPSSFVKGAPWADPMPSEIYDLYEIVLSQDEKDDFKSTSITEKRLKDWLETTELNFNLLKAFEKSLKREIK
ncbi:MAG: outer membrane protein OmpA-like peptidoglycan-associated protein [Kiritimatiellia bacterium]|jgi:outer membrane protein OmpA-like peptidoglycan-associated protein